MNPYYTLLRKPIAIYILTDFHKGIVIYYGNGFMKGIEICLHGIRRFEVSDP